ncbi:MAG: MBL fold metallo-hydrolase [Acholeplasmatales bacterium]|nr:MBL fold metallo-hydrolase [Acholeplasmatales bacterium]
MIKKIVSNDIIDMNVYLIIDENKCFIVDPGGNYSEIEKTIKELNLEVLGILLTHAHVDHTYLIGKFNCPIYIHEKEVEILKYSNLSLYDSFGFDMPFNYLKLDIKKIKDNDIIKLNDKEIKVIHTPGHTKGSVCYLIDNKLFSGDTLFKESCGRCDLPSGSEVDMAKSLIKLIDNLDEFIKVYPGHDETTTIKHEKEFNAPYKYYKKVA